MLEISLLGPPEIKWNGSPLEIQRRTLRALLFYLALHLSGCDRTELCNLFWADRSETQARAALRTALARLRKSLPDPTLLQVGRELVGLDQARLAVDVLVYREVGTRAHRAGLACPPSEPLPPESVHLLRQAVSTWRSPRFLGGAAMPATPEFDLWMRSLDANLASSRVTLVQRLADHFAATGDLEGALMWARSILQEDELDDELHTRVVRWLLELGRRSEAIETCTRIENLYRAEIDGPLPPALAAICRKVRQTAQVEAGGRAAAKRTLALFLVDGLRPEALQPSVTPTLCRWIENGASTLSAQTVTPSISLPAILSLFLSIPPEMHGIQDNNYQPPLIPVWGLLELLHARGRTTAGFYNWDPLRDIARPDVFDLAFCINNCELPGAENGQGDVELADLACDWLERRSFDFVFVYLGCTDTAGHRFGWLSNGYLEAAANADRCIARLAAALPPGSATIYCSDHGGHGMRHGTSDPQDMTVPLIFHGPGFGKGRLQYPATTLDIAPTVAAWFGIEKLAAWQGTVLAAALA